MARLTLNERFTLDAPPARTWEFLRDPERTVVCLPGATLTETVDERTYRGNVTVQVGPVTVRYSGEAVFEERDDAARRMVMRAEGREAKGSGTATMTMTGLVEEAEGGGSAVSVNAEVEVAGKIVRFGRGMIERVNQEVFREFTACLGEQLEGAAAEREEAEAAPPNALVFVWRALVRWLKELAGRG